MGFIENLESIRKELKLNGFAMVNEPFNLNILKREDIVSDIEIIANKENYSILYVEVKSNWKSIATEVAKKYNDPCLIITNYKHNNLILTTLKDYLIDPAPRHIVIDSNSKSHTFQKFCKLIKVGPGDNIESIEVKVHSAFNKYSEYAEALRKFADNLDDIIKNTTQLIESKISKNKKYDKEAHKLLKVCKKTINDQMELDDIKDMLIQHILTYRIFALVYDEQDFDHKNIIARSLEVLKDTLDLDNEKINYETMEIISESITDTDQKQEFLKKIYETFYEKYDAKKADKDGIVYTPNQVVKFIIQSVNELLQENFTKDVSDKNVTILDPFTGTGTFIVHLLRQIDPKRLNYKYTNEIYANEISILPYYIAALNIENTYAELTDKYKEFENICWMDTFDIGIKNYNKITEYVGLEDNIKRIIKQQKSKIHVIIGNPPYHVGQPNQNDQNQNMKYPALDKRIEDTYVNKSLSTNKNSLYDSYIRSLRWASDRIGDSGIIGFVINGSFIQSSATIGIRAFLHEEFTDVYCFNLRGNIRLYDSKEGGNIFGNRSQTPIAIIILVKNPKKNKHTIYYKDIGDRLKTEQKLDIIEKCTSIQGIKDWQIISPDDHHDWIGHRNIEFNKYSVMGSKKTKTGKSNDSMFTLYSMGIKTNRDAWAYNSSEKILSKNMKRTIDYYNKQDIDNPIIDDKQISWSSGLDILKKHKPKFNKNKIRTVLYRPFFKQYLYYDKTFNERQYQIPKIFPEEDSENIVIIIPYHHNSSITAFIANITPDVEVVHHGQCFPLFRFENDKRVNNITDYILDQYHKHYENYNITKKDIFYYVYGILHHEGYRTKYKNNLQKEMPRIPMAPEFNEFVTAGRKLADLHLNYETCKEYTLKPKAKFDMLDKMTFGKTEKNGKKVTDETKIIINGIEVFDLPKTKYTVNGRSPIKWMKNQYKIKNYEDIGIINDSTKGMTEEKTIELIQRLTYIAVESDKIIEELSKLEFEPPEDWNPELINKVLDEFTNS